MNQPLSIWKHTFYSQKNSNPIGFLSLERKVTLFRNRLIWATWKVILFQSILWAASRHGHTFSSLLLLFLNFIQSLFSNSAVALAFKFIKRWETQFIGAQWNNFNDNARPEDTFSIAWCVFFLYLDAFFYWILTWYFEQVLPRKYNDMQY